MKLPRDLSGRQLVQGLGSNWGYRQVHQVGSHIIIETAAAQDGQSLHLIGDVLNHRDPKTTAGYAYFQTKQRRDALTGHGNRVLALTPSHLRKPKVPTGISAGTLLPAADDMLVIATENGAAHYRHYFKREDLYRLVWTSPVSEIAARLGVSDVALAKLCRRAAILFASVEGLRSQRVDSKITAIRSAGKSLGARELLPRHIRERVVEIAPGAEAKVCRTL